MDPGESLFCGGVDSLQPNTNAGHKEEEEELEDQHRRKLELRNLLSDAFNDVTDNEEDEDDDCSDRSGQSVNEDSPQVSPSGYYSYDTPLSRLHADKYSYKNGSDDPLKAHHRMYNGQHTVKASERFPPQNGITNGCSPAEEDDHDGYYDHHAYHMDAGRMNGDGYSPTDDHYYRNADLGSHEQLMVLYTARVREVKSLTDALECLRHEKDSEIELLKRQLLLMETEKQGALISQKEAHNLLAASKTQVNSLQQELDQLQTSNENLEKEKTELLKEVNLLRSSATDLQQKVTLLERNGNTIVPSEKQMESFYKAMQQRHQIQLRDMQSQLENVMDKLKVKEGECISLEEKLRNATRAYDALQVGKAETVNRLATQLEETQQKLQKLASSSALHETTKLQVMLEQIQSEKQALEEKLASTSKKLESVEKDLHQYESASRLGLFNNEDSSFETDSIAHLGINRRHSVGGKSDKHADNSRDSCRSKRTSMDQEDLSSKLKTELQRALQGQHSKREEIRRLQEQLALKEKKIKSMLEQERIYVTESKKYEANLSGVLERLKRQQEDLKTAHGNEARLEARCEELEKNLIEAKEMIDRLQVFEQENAALKEEIRVAQREGKEKRFDMENYDEALTRAKEEVPAAVEKELIDLKVRLEQSQKECAEIKQLYIQLSADKRELMSRLEEKDSRLGNVRKERDELEELYRQAQETVKNLKADINNLQKSLNDLKSTTDENPTEIEKVKEENERKCRQLLERIEFLERENKRANDLEAECLRLQEELAIAPNRHQKELERISKELSYSRERVVQLERKLRDEFQTQIDSMTSEIDSLQKQIDQKNQLLEEYAQALSRLKPATEDAAVETTEEGLREKTAALAMQLEKAEERHRHVVETLRQEFDRRIAAREREMKAVHERQLVLIAARYKTEVEAIEDQVKEEAAKYFAEEVSALQEKHAQEHAAVMKRMKEGEAAFTNHIELLKRTLQERMNEVEELKKKVENGNCDDVKQLQQQIDSERDKMAEMLNCWATEMKDLRNQVTTLSEELGAVRAKYKEMKKLAIHYKKQVAQSRQDEKVDWQRKERGYLEALCRVKERVNEVVENHEKERRSLDEKHYENQLLGMAAKLRSEKL